MDSTAIIEALGGATSLAQEVGLCRSAVYNWHAAGIPAVHCVRLAELARERGLTRPFRDRDGRRQPGIKLETLMTSKPRPDRAKTRAPRRAPAASLHRTEDGTTPG